MGQGGPTNHRIIDIMICVITIIFVIFSSTLVAFEMCDTNQQYFKIADLHFVKSEWFSLTWSCESRQRDTISRGWKFRLIYALTQIVHMYLMIIDLD